MNNDKANKPTAEEAFSGCVVLIFILVIAGVVLNAMVSRCTRSSSAPAQVNILYSDGTLSSQTDITASMFPSSNIDDILMVIFSLAKDNPSTIKIKLLIHWHYNDRYGNSKSVDFPIELNSLDNVRKYADDDYYLKNDVDDHQAITEQMVKGLAQITSNPSN